MSFSFLLLHIRGCPEDILNVLQLACSFATFGVCAPAAIDIVPEPRLQCPILMLLLLVIIWHVLSFVA